ncbi:MAG: DUF4830 domain-containing protein [Clostridia bacterium]|nr:DUF4830 domain-containing protein [Clostridia bacterium]
MFIYSVRASHVRFFALLAAAVVLLVGFVALGGSQAVFASAEAGGDYSFGGVKDAEGRLSFLSQFGIEVKGDAEEQGFTMPQDFDRVLRGYNEVQKAQGLDLSKYVGKNVTRYTYEVSNAACEGTVYATILVYRGRVIACDVSSADPTGFVKPMTDFLSIAKTAST